MVHDLVGPNTVTQFMVFMKEMWSINGMDHDLFFFFVDKKMTMILLAQTL